MADIGKIITTLSAAYPNFRPVDRSALLELWDRKLGNLEQTILELAADRIIDISTWFPSLKEFLLAYAYCELEHKRAMADLHVRIRETNELRTRQDALEREAMDFGYDAGAWEEMARAWEYAGREFAAQACREKAKRIQEAVGVSMETPLILEENHEIPN